MITDKTGGKFDSLVKLVIVLTCLLLAGTFYFQWSLRSPESADDREKRQIAFEQVELLAQAVIKFSNYHKRFPLSFKELSPDYIASVPLDPYEKPYRIINNGPDKIFVYYYGKNGRSRGLAERDRDIGAVIINEEGTYKRLQ